jgi:hypothetical protein
MYEMVFPRKEKFSKGKRGGGAAGGYTVKKVNDFPVPGRDVTNQTLSGRESFGIIKLFPARESLIGGIPAADGKIDNLFYSVWINICFNLYKRTKTPV